METKEYWDDFYKKNLAPIKESNFAQVIFEYLQKNKLTNLKLIDIACGNGRDTFFFSQNGIDSTGIDISVQPQAKSPIFIKENILTFDYLAYDLIYMRFIVHALNEDDLDILLTKLKQSTKNQYIFIETRSSKGITDERKSETYFKSSIGEEHFRMLYSESYLTEKLEKYFTIEQVDEAQGFSIYKNEDPFCIRYILRNSKN
jgi:SAM-dependent methyltransferase